MFSEEVHMVADSCVIAMAFVGLVGWLLSKVDFNRKLRVMVKELSPNGGTSVKDRVAKVERGQLELGQKTDDLNEKTERLNERLEKTQEIQISMLRDLARKVDDLPTKSAAKQDSEQHHKGRK